MTWKSIPEEMRELPQWVGATQDKLPVNPKTGKSASVTDPRSWGTFEQACACGAPHIGFVFTKEDPYVFIDLDTGKAPELAGLHAEIVEKADSYTETSISQKGSHIVVKGSIADGIRADEKALEIYPHSRYMLMTGWWYHGPQAPQHCQELLDYLQELIQSRRVEKISELVSEDSSISDHDVYEKAISADNGDKFEALWNGNWVDYPEYMNDHSRADLALLIFLDFYSKDVNQVVRLFKESSLYRPDKGRKNGDGTDYILRTLTSARSFNEASNEPIDVGEMMERAHAAIAQSQATVVKEELPKEAELVFPGGLVGDIAQYIYSAAIRPVPEVALVGALALVAGVTGRQYNINGSGLNLYLILLAATGSGKEGAASGISKLMKAVQQTVPAADQFIGPGEFASGPGLIKALENQPAFFSILGEFGLRIAQMADPRSNGAEKTLQKALLNLYSKSGWHQDEKSIVYSDREKNTKTVHAPALTILGETTPESFFSRLDESQVQSGLLPRFSFLEYTGARPPMNMESAFCDPEPGLVDRVANLIAGCIQMQQNSTKVDVLVDAHGQSLLTAFNEYCDGRINEGSEVYKQLWNRAHLKAMRLASVIAVGENSMSPVVSAIHAEWAINFVRRDIYTIEHRFKQEKVGEGEHQHEGEIRTAIEYYLTCGVDKRKSYQVPKALLMEPVIPYSYLRRRLRQLNAFKNDRRGPSVAIQMALKDLVDAGILQLMPTLQRKQKYKINSDLYVLGESW